MLTDVQMEALLKAFDKRWRAVITKYLTDMGRHLYDIGQLLPSDANRIIEMRRMGINLEHIQKQIAHAAEASVEDVLEAMQAVAQDDARYAQKIYGQEVTADHPALRRAVLSQFEETLGEMANLSRTTVVSDAYRDAVDVAVQSIQGGVSDYRSSIRKAVEAAAAEGLKVTYASGRRMRLDSAMRMNVLDGLRSLNQRNFDALGETFGADGVEISAHPLCAEDHLPYQGKQYSHAAFALLQENLDRPIGMWNCKHMCYPILLGVSQPAYSDKDLEEMRRNSAEQLTIGDKTQSRYEWTQEQRKTETAIRRQEERAVLAKAAGDDVVRRDAQYKINALHDHYDKITEAAGLKLQRDRMYVPGFKPTGEKELKKPVKSGIIETEENNRFKNIDHPASETYQKKLDGRYDNGTEQAKRVYDKYVPAGGAIENAKYAAGTAHIDPETGRIVMSYRKDTMNMRGAGTTWFHEHGHYVDRLANRPSLNLDYAQAIARDCRNYESAYKKANKLATIADTRIGVGNELVSQGDKTHSIQDIFGGVVGKRYPGAEWGHDVEFWKNNGSAGVCREAFAHMFEASFDPEKRALMEKYLPNAWAEFEKMLEVI